MYVDVCWMFSIFDVTFFCWTHYICLLFVPLFLLEPLVHPMVLLLQVMALARRDEWHFAEVDSSVSSESGSALNGSTNLLRNHVFFCWLGTESIPGPFLVSKHL